MVVASGTRLGVYEVIAAIGAGGMGEVYRARDTRLQRNVAIKILPEIFAADPERLARFEREAQALAALNHSNIAQIYGIEEGPAEAGHYVRALVMELVEGETLHDRIALGPIPVDEALTIARHIADALDAAHQKGIIHRDLKPANIKVSDAGAVKVLDFGLAKLAETGPAHRLRQGSGGQEGGHDDVTISPTITSPMVTGAGMLLGTAAYMAPEQARGKAVDKRADIWAFGLIVYEMVTGKRPFAGETITDVLASIVRDDVDLSRLPDAVQRLVRPCLEKDPAKRLRDLGDLPFLLSEPRGAKAAPSVRTRAVPWTVAGLLFLALVAISWRHLREPGSEPGPTLHFQIGSLEALPASAAFAVSPDGTTVAYHAAGGDGVMRIWLRRLDAREAHPLVGTESTRTTPIWWSPDGGSIAFTSGTGGTLSRIAVNGGTPQVVCEVALPIVGGSWNADDVIIFGQTGGTLMRVSARGGVATPLTVLNQARTGGQHVHPFFLPDGHHFVYRRVESGVVNAMDEESGVYVGSLDVAAEAQSSTRLLVASSSAMFAASPVKASEGHLLFMRNNTLMAQRFDPASLSLEGEPQQVAEPVGLFNDRGAFSVSQTGRLVYREGSSSGLSLAVFTPNGGLKPVGEQATYYGVALSPDGTKAAVTRIGGNRDIWLYDVGRDVSTRFTFHPGLDDVPIWSPDGRTIVFASDRGGSTRELFAKPANGARDEELLLNAGAIVAPTDWSRDGRYILYTVRTPDKGLDVNVLAHDTRRTATLLGTTYDEEMAALSPDGKWVGYLSNESGRTELYVRRFLVENDQPVVAGKWMISNSGAYQFWWGSTGKTIYYIPRSSTSIASLAPLSTTTGGLTIEAVDVAPTLSEFAIARPRMQMKVPGTIYGLSLRGDGSMAMLVVPGRSDTRGADLDVVVNWQEMLAR